MYYLSGQLPAEDVLGQIIGERHGIERETRSVMNGIRAILERQHLTMTNIVSVTVYLTDLDDFAGMNSVYDTYFPSTRPARSVVEVQRLPGNARIQVSVVAGR